MPLLERARVEVYLPDLPHAAYYKLLEQLTQEFTYTFGGCTTIQGLDGSYLSEARALIRDRINVIYTDTPYAFQENKGTLSNYCDRLKAAIDVALDEEAVLITCASIYHANDNSN